MSRTSLNQEALDDDIKKRLNAGDRRTTRATSSTGSRTRLAAEDRRHDADADNARLHGDGGQQVSHGKRTRSYETAHPQCEEHAADHQGHEDGFGGQAAPRAGARLAGRPYAQMLTERAQVAGASALIWSTPKPAIRCIRCWSSAKRRRITGHRDRGRQGFRGADSTTNIRQGRGEPLRNLERRTA